MVQYQKVRFVYLFRNDRIRMKFSVPDITPNSADNNLLATIIIRLDCVSYELELNQSAVHTWCCQPKCNGMASVITYYVAIYS